MKKTVITIIAAIMTIASCQKENPAGSNAPVLKVLLDPATRTSLGEDGLSVNWSSSDQIMVADGEGNKVSGTLASSEGSSATFTLSGELNTYKYVSYPFRSTSNYKEYTVTTDGTATTSETGFKTKVDASLTAVSGSWASKANTSVGKVTDGVAVLENVMALLKFEISSTDVKSVVFSGNNNEIITGFPVFDPEALEFLGFEYNNTTGTAITLTSITPGVYYIPVLPITFAQGLKLELKDSDSNVIHTQSTSKEKALVRNKIYDLGVESDWRRVSENLSITLEFSTGVSSGQTYWPFTETKDTYMGTTNSKTTIVNHAGNVFYLTCSTGSYQIGFRIQDGNYADSNVTGTTNCPYYLSWSITGGAGLRFGALEGDYILFPAIANYALSQVTIFTGTQKCGGISIMTHPSEGESAVVAGGTEASIDSSSSYKTWTLTGTEANTAYRATLTDNNNGGKRLQTPKIQLVYKPVN